MGAFKLVLMLLSAAVIGYLLLWMVGMRPTIRNSFEQYGTWGVFARDAETRHPALRGALVMLVAVIISAVVVNALFYAYDNIQ
jgi:hypothetical protein